MRYLLECRPVLYLGRNSFLPATRRRYLIPESDWNIHPQRSLLGNRCAISMLYLCSTCPNSSSKIVRIQIRSLNRDKRFSFLHGSEVSQGAYLKKGGWLEGRNYQRARKPRPKVSGVSSLILRHPRVTTSFYWAFDNPFSHAVFEVEYGKQLWYTALSRWSSRVCRVLGTQERKQWDHRRRGDWSRHSYYVTYCG